MYQLRLHNRLVWEQDVLRLVIFLMCHLCFLLFKVGVTDFLHTKGPLYQEGAVTEGDWRSFKFSP